MDNFISSLMVNNGRTLACIAILILVVVSYFCGKSCGRDESRREIDRLKYEINLLGFRLKNKETKDNN